MTNVLPDFSILQPMLTAISEFEHEGTSYRFLVSNPFEYTQIYHAKRQLYEVECLEMIAAVFPRGGTFVDVGANVGNHAIFAAKQLGAGQVIAFEPGLVAHTILCVNKALNGVTRIDIRKKALSDWAGEGLLMTGDSLHLGGSKLAEEGPGQKVPVVTGDSELADATVSFIKIDVEGSELEVLRGLSEVISTQRPGLLVEVKDDNRPAFDAWCADAGYSAQDSVRRYPGEANLLVMPVP